MEITILNCYDKRLEYLSRTAAKYFSEQLIQNTRIRNNCKVTIEFTDELRVLKRDGECGIDGYNTMKKPRTFSIRLSNDGSYHDKLSTLAHEMVHVKQYAYCQINDDLSKWKSKRVNSDIMEYEKYPWEIEANKRGDKLYLSFLNDTGTVVE